MDEETQRAIAKLKQKIKDRAIRRAARSGGLHNTVLPREVERALRNEIARTWLTHMSNARHSKPCVCMLRITEINDYIVSMGGDKVNIEDITINPDKPQP